MSAEDKDAGRTDRTLADLFEEADYEVRAYSGRAMMGKECLAVHVSNAAEAFILGKIVGQAIREEQESGTEGDIEFSEFLEQIGAPRIDSLGFDAVIYWPNLQWGDRFVSYFDE